MIYCACLFYCLEQLMRMMIYLLDMPTIFQAKLCDGSLPFRAIHEVLVQLRLSDEKNGVCIQSFSFSTIHIDIHGKLMQGFINWE